MVVRAAIKETRKGSAARLGVNDLGIRKATVQAGDVGLEGISSAWADQVLTVQWVCVHELMAVSMNRLSRRLYRHAVPCNLRNGLEGWCI